MTQEIKLTMSLSDLEMMLDNQKREIAEYITRNLTVYTFWQGDNASNMPYDLTGAKDEMKAQVMKSGYPSDFETLKRYLA